MGAEVQGQQPGPVPAHLNLNFIRYFVVFTAPFIQNPAFFFPLWIPIRKLIYCDKINMNLTNFPNGFVK